MILYRKSGDLKRAKQSERFNRLFCPGGREPMLTDLVYPFTPPWITPFSILSWKKGNAMMIEAMAAMITANWIR
jgi:hypothetical protein